MWYICRYIYAFFWKQNGDSFENYEHLNLLSLKFISIIFVIRPVFSYYPGFGNEPFFLRGGSSNNYSLIRPELIIYAPVISKFQLFYDIWKFLIKCWFFEKNSGFNKKYNFRRKFLMEICQIMFLHSDQLSMLVVWPNDFWNFGVDFSDHVFLLNILSAKISIGISNISADFFHFWKILSNLEILFQSSSGFKYKNISNALAKIHVFKISEIDYKTLYFWPLKIYQIILVLRWPQF